MQLSPFAADHDLDIFPRFAGYKIPYFTSQGKIDPKFYRFRFLQYKPLKGFGAIAEDPKKPRRYAQPKGSQCEIYMPPLLDRPWTAIMSNPDIPLCITEGEKKAATACAHGVMPTIGLGGVFSWKSAKLGVSFLAVLEEFVWKKRSVYLLFDSDLDTNPQVQIALSQLARALTDRGAVVHHALLPSIGEDKKQGLDDYLVEHGPEALEQLIVKAEPVSSSIALHDMNVEFAVIKQTAEVVKLDEGLVWTSQKFADVVYKNRKYTEFVFNSKGEQLVPRVKYTAKEWLEWPQRTTLKALVYEPGSESITPNGEYNAWRGWGCAPSKSGTIAPWEELVSLLTLSARTEHAIWLKRWFAYPLRHPGVKLYSAIVMWGMAQGTGKTLLGDTMRRIYGVNFRTVSNSDLVSAYNDWVVNRQFIVGDEISTGDGSRRTLTDNLKDVITREQAVVNLKYRAQYTIRDCANYYFTSNHSNAFYIEDADRRYFVNEVTERPADARFYRRYVKWLDEEGGAARLFHYLLHELDMGDFDPKGHAPVTQAKVEMIMAGKSDLADWCMRLKANPDSILIGAGKPLSHALYTNQDLMRIYDPEEKKRVSLAWFAREMSSAGFKRIASGSNNIVIDGTRHRLWIVRNVDKLARLGPTEAAKLYQEERDAAAGPKFSRRVQ